MSDELRAIKARVSALETDVAELKCVSAKLGVCIVKIRDDLAQTATKADVTRAETRLSSRIDVGVSRIISSIATLVRAQR